MGGIILIVDDSETSVAALELALAGISGIGVEFAHSGAEALRMLDGRVRAIVTDLEMPRMDGFELIRRVRAERAYARLPIVVVSAATDPAAPERARSLGADAFFSKPCSPAAVRGRLEQLLASP